MRHEGFFVERENVRFNNHHVYSDPVVVDWEKMYVIKAQEGFSSAVTSAEKGNPNIVFPLNTTFSVSF